MTFQASFDFASCASSLTRFGSWRANVEDNRTKISLRDPEFWRGRKMLSRGPAVWDQEIFCAGSSSCWTLLPPEEPRHHHGRGSAPVLRIIPLWRLLPICCSENQNQTGLSINFSGNSPRKEEYFRRIRRDEVVIVAG